MASKFAPSPQGVTETPFEMMGGLDFIRYSYEVLMYGVVSTSVGNQSIGAGFA